MTHRQLVMLNFRKNRLAVIGMWILVALYGMALFCDFLAPYDPNRRFGGNVYVPPMVPHIRTEDGIWTAPFVYEMTRKTDPRTFERKYTQDTSQRYPIRLFVRGEPYRFLGLIPSDLHLYGSEDPSKPVFLLGSDAMGRDLLSRILYGSRISLSVGLVGVFASLLIGLALGGVSGYYGGALDNVLQVYFGITIILSLVGWTTLARVIRGKFLALREEDYVLAALQAGAKPGFVIREHLLPAFMSYILVHLTLAVPGPSSCWSQ
jgi:peptide/nickel transport system permease protein